MTSSASDLSIVIVSWNSRALLLDCLESVFQDLATTPGLRTEVFVVDNASQDGSADAVSRAFPGVQVRANPQNVGFARANNQALREARGRFYLLLNPDTRVSLGALATLITTLDAHPDAGACGPLLQNPDGTLQPSWARFPGFFSEWTGRLDRSQLPNPEVAKAPCIVDWVGGACLMVRAQAARTAGLLDEAFFLYGEEVEWCYRLRRHGWQTLLVPGAGVIHYGGGSSALLSAEETRRRLFVARRHLYRRLYGPLGALPPGIVAAARYAVGYVLRKVGRR